MELLVVNMLLLLLLCEGGPSTLKKTSQTKKSAPTYLTRCADDDETQQCHQIFYAGQGDGGGKLCSDKPTLQWWGLFEVRPKS